VALYFPKQFHSTRYEALYQRLPAYERMLLLREFVGLTYRRRFIFFQKQHAAAAISPTPDRPAAGLFSAAAESVQRRKTATRPQNSAVRCFPVVAVWNQPTIYHDLIAGLEE
jgi:hypothetical protein